MVPNVLSIAGSDPSGGAGVQADLKTFAALGCHGMAVLSALTAQNTQGVFAVHTPPADFVGAQIDAIFADIDVAAVKIGMLANAEIVAVVAERLRAHKPRFVVLDPVLASTSGDSLGAEGVIGAMVSEMFPLADLVTPNAPEAAQLVGGVEPQDMASLEALGVRLRARGAHGVLLKGGHLEGAQAIDVWLADGVRREFAAPRVATRNTHGTGCTLSAAIAAHVAQGLPLEAAIVAAKDYLSGALAHSGDLNVGAGHGPVHHFWRLWRGA